MGCGGTKFEWDHHIKRLKDSFVMTFCFLGPLIMWHRRWMICGLVLTDTCFWWQMHCPPVIGTFLSDMPPCWGTKRARRDTSWWLTKSSRGYHRFFNPVDRPWPWHDFCQKGHWGWVSTEHAKRDSKSKALFRFNHRGSIYKRWFSGNWNLH